MCMLRESVVRRGEKDFIYFLFDEGILYIDVFFGGNLLHCFVGH